MNEYTTLDSSTILEASIFTVVSDTVSFPNGIQTNRITVQHSGAVVILPYHKGLLYFVKQYRHALKDIILEFPAGILEKGEAPIDCAKRELSEELALGANRWVELGKQYPTPGFCDEVQYCYFATECFERSLPCDNDELITVETMTPRVFEQKIKMGEIIDSKSIALYTKAKLNGLIPQKPI